VKKLLLSAIIITGVVCIGFLPVTTQKSIEVNAGIYRISDQLVYADAAAKWIVPFAEDNSKNISIENGAVQKISNAEAKVLLQPLSSLATQYTFNAGNKSQKFTFSIIANDNTTRKNTVALVYKTTLLNKLFGFNQLAALAEKSLANLKTYMEDPLQLYGYDIKVAAVTDTSFLVKRITVKKSEVADKADALFKELIAFAEKNNGGFTGVRIFHKERVTNDEYDISAGIGVSRSFPVLAGQGIEYKMMPLGKNLLVTTYAGPYGDIMKAYEAMDRFKKDNALSSMAIPFEKLPDGAIKLSDEEMVKLEIYYPVF
jgi:hypothetical protein